MVKYLFSMRKQHLLLFFTLLTLAFSLSPEPLAVCTVHRNEQSDFPISIQETQTFNPNDFFRGYNLRYELQTAPDFAYLRDKFKLTKTQDKPQPGFKSYHFDHQRNNWGTKLVTISEQNDSSIVRWGAAGANDTVPTLTGQLIVENEPSIKCFDAIWMRHLSVIMVDCVKDGSFGGLQNIFLYLNTTSQVIIPKIINNDMYVPFRNITRRRMTLLEQDGQSYMMRAYYANGVDEKFNHNTYLEIFLINDPFRPWTIKVIDRSFLHQDKLTITDFQVYLGDMYILDYHTGVTRFDISPSQDILITGRYRTDSGYHRLGVYSNNLANQFLLVLANSHGIYEVDWTNTIRPEIIAKYSLMEGSHVSSLWVSEEYVVAQVRANVTNSQNLTEDYHSTFIFDRGTRTYMNAYAVIPHTSYRAAIDMNIEHRLILSIDQDKLSVYQIDQPMISLLPTDPLIVLKQFKFTIQATSTNEYNGHSAVCSYKISLMVVPIDSLALWPTGLKVPQTYYANFPGQLVIPLDRYVLGPNITWGVQEKTTKGQLPVYWIYQQNDTILHWPKIPSMAKITFLRQQQFDTVSTQYIFIYSQDAANITHMSFCKTTPGDINVYCQDDAHHPVLNHKIVNLTATVFVPYSGKFVHLAAIIFETFPNEVFIVDVTTKQMPYKPIALPDGFEGRIQSIQFLGQYLAVVLRHMKTIVFYDMNQCHDHQEKQCQQVHRIDSILMDRLGVKYFSPLQIYTSDFHPNVLFIQNVDSVIILDITARGFPILLEVIQSPASKQPGFWKWKMAITHGHLVLINPPNTIQQHSLQQLYTRKQTHMTKTFPVYNYTIPDKFDCDFSDQGDLLYITAIDPQLPPGRNSVILVYRSGYPAVATFYDVYHIEGAYEDMLIDATGNFADYVSVAMGSMLHMYRQYQVPILVFEDTFFDFKFNLTFTNDPKQRYHYLSTSSVQVANFPKDIVVNFSKLNQSNYLTSQVQYNNKHQQFTFDDSNWFTGQVINYTLESCNECGKKFKVINHLQDKRDFYGETDMEDYVFTPEGGVIQQFQSLIQMRHNGSVHQIVALPSVLDGQACTHIQHSWIYDYTLSACRHQDQIYLYTTTYTSFKPFVNGPFYSGAKAVAGIHIMEDIMIIVDVDQDPSPMTRAGGILIYAMNHDPFDPQMFDEIQFIDRQDLQSAPEWIGGDVFIGNAELVFTNDTQLYRLVITEMRHGLFVVDFRWSRGRDQIQIVKIQFLDLNKLLVAQNLHMPNMAYYEAVTITNNYYDPTYKYWQTQFVVTTRNFHIFQINCHISRTGQILTTELAKVYYRYGFFETTNYIKQFDGYFAVVQKLPAIFEVFDWYNRVVLTLYDTRQRWVFNQSKPAQVKTFEDTKVPAYQMLGGMVFPKGRVTFDFNFTFTRNRTDPFRNIGLLVLHAGQDKIREVLIHDHLTIVTEDGIIQDQKANLVANNDFSHVKIPVSILVQGGLSGGAIAAIVIGCLIIAIGGGYMIYRWNLKRKSKIESDIERSLIQRDTYDPSKPLGGSNQNDDQDDDQEQQQDDDDQEQQEEQQEQEQNLKDSKPQQQSQITQNTSFNKETVASEPVTQVKQEQKEPEVEAGEQAEQQAGQGEQGK